jgi:hypothetical protein
VSRPADWWPLSETDPVPGDPQTLAALGSRLGNAATEIEAMARTLPTLCTSDMWDSEAGEQFREKAALTATAIAKVHRRFCTVSMALGNSIYGDSGYAAQLQESQDRADAAIDAVNGGYGSGGSEADRRSAWFLLLDATGGADPSQPPAKHGAAGPAAGPMPQASPGVVPAHLPSFGDDTGEVSALKNRYNADIDQLRSSAQAINEAVAEYTTAAHAAAQMIMTAIDNDGLKNSDGLKEPPGTDWGQLANDLDGLRSLWTIPTETRIRLEEELPGLEEASDAAKRVAMRNLIANIKVQGKGARLDPGVQGTLNATRKAVTAQKDEIADVHENAANQFADGDADGLGLTGLAAAGVRAIPYIGATVGAGITIYQDREAGESWDHAIADGVVSSSAALAAGIGAAAAVTAIAAAAGATTFVAVGVSIAVSGVVAVGVGDFTHNVFQENWSGDWHKYGVLDGTAHGIADSADKTRHDLAHYADDLNPF